MSVFNAYARYYDLLYQDKDYAGETRFIGDLIKRFSPQTKSVLELGCGTGIHAAKLSDTGLSVHGVDFSRDMLESARARAQSLETDHAARLSFTCDDIRHHRQDKRYDAVISLFHVVSYQTTGQDLAAVFETANLHLKPGGVFIFDCWYGPAVLSDKPAVRVKRLEDQEVAIIRIAEPLLHANQNLVDVNYQVFVKEKLTGRIEELNEVHSMRYLFYPEVERLCADSGFLLLDSGGWMSDKKAGFDTWGVYFVARIE